MQKIFAVICVFFSYLGMDIIIGYEKILDM